MEGWRLSLPKLFARRVRPKPPPNPHSKASRKGKARVVEVAEEEVEGPPAEQELPEEVPWDSKEANL
eukprot:10551888-Lingulodinium_polyedra.AAC.1